MEIPLLNDIIALFVFSIVALLICHRIGVPSIVGFLLTGILCGPHGLKLVTRVEDVNTLAEVGIVLLLFTVGLEFSIKKILEYKRFFFIGGVLQVIFTILVGSVFAYSLDRSIQESLFLGFLLCLSSTAIVLRLLQERLESQTPHGRMILGILIFQDIITVPMMLLVPLLETKNGYMNNQAFVNLGIGFVILAVVFFVYECVVPNLMHLIARTGTRQLFLLTVVVICLTVAWVASSVGLSLALGAFLAGLIIADTEYHDEAMGGILPFLDVFSSFFFISIGMLLDLGFVLSNFLLVVAVTLGVVLMKFFVTSSVGLFLGMPLRTSLLAGIALAQVGEFSFLLAKSGMDYHLGSHFYYQLFLAISISTMAATPFLITFGPTICRFFLKLPFPEKILTGFHPIRREEQSIPQDHVLIIGYGVVGKYLSHATKSAKIPYAILDLNADEVREQQKLGEPIFYGDATHPSVLKHVHATTARVIAVVINDQSGAHRVIKHCRKLNPKAHIISRSRDIHEMQHLYKLGVNEVISDQLSASIEAFLRVLLRYNVSEEKIDELVDEMRHEGYEMLYSRNIYKSK